MSFWFEKGNILLTANSCPPACLVSFIPATRAIEPHRLESALARASDGGTPLLRSLVETGGLTPTDAWDLLLNAWKEWFFGHFELRDGEFFFESLTPDDSIAYTELPTLELILEGIRRMKNTTLIEAFLPQESESLQIAPSPHAGLLPLAPYEKYILRLASTGACLKEIYSRCDLGRSECQRTLFALICLDMASPGSNKAQSRRTAELPWNQLEKVLLSFNEKCAYIFRFISKEIGPVAYSVLERAIEEIRPELGPLFLNMEFREDGRLNFPDAGRLYWQFHNENLRQAFIRGLNEILAAEVLAVKRTLGPTFESVLVHSLEKIGEGC